MNPNWEIPLLQQQQSQHILLELQLTKDIKSTVIEEQRHKLKSEKFDFFFHKKILELMNRLSK